jgi:hypothetical protein
VTDRGKLRKGFVGAAGRTAFALLRTTSRRAKLGTLHLPIGLHPGRQEPILLPQQVHPQAAPATAPERLEPTTALTPEVRALRSRLAVAERRNARLRYALERERLAATRVLAVRHEPTPLIEHLVADLTSVGTADEASLRQTVSSVLAAYGFAVAAADPVADTPVTEATSVPGFDRRRLDALSQSIVAAQPEIGNARYIQLIVGALARQGALTVQQLSNITGYTSPMARRRLRLALDALDAAGVARMAGSRYSLAPQSIDKHST